MIRLSVLYPATAGTSFNWDYYHTHHLALVKKLLPAFGLVRVEFDRGVGGFPPGTPAPFHAIAHLVFNNIEDMQRAMEANAAELKADIPKYTDVQSVLQISEIVG